MVEDDAFIQKIDYFFLEILNFKGHPNRITGSRVLLNGWILPIRGASAVEGLRSTELPSLVFSCPELL